MTSADDIGAPLGGATSEVLARAMHEHYVRRQRGKGELPEENPSLVAWDDLDESLKESSRRFAEGIGEKLEAAGCALVAASPGEGHPSFQFSDEQVESLARLEHDRWASDLERDGWQWGPAKDAAGKEHPLLVPWSKLSEEERDKDRAAVRRVPAMLLQAGFRIQRVT